MDSLLDYIEQNKRVSLLLALFIILCGVFYFLFHIEDKATIQVPTVMKTSKIKYIEFQESDDFEELTPIQELIIQKVKVITKELKEKSFVLSSTTIGIYTISLNTYHEVENLHQTDILYCALTLQDKELVFNMKIDKELLKTIDKVFIKVTINGTRFVVEDAYILKELKEDNNYMLTLLLYDDYVSLSLHDLGKKRKQTSGSNRDLKIKLSQLGLSKSKTLPDEILKSLLVKPIEFKMLRDVGKD